MPARGARPGGAALPELLRAFEAELDFVYRNLRRQGASPADAEDLVQEVFLVVWRRWRDYDPERPLRPWLAGIAFRVAREHHRRTRREVPSGVLEGEAPGGVLDVSEETASPHDQLVAAHDRSLIRRALAALPERQRAILVLYELEGMAIPEVAGALGVPASTLYSRLHKAHQNLARSVRRLQRGVASPREALRALQEVPGTLPPETRRRLLARLRALAPGPVAAPRWRGPVFATAAVLLVAVLALGGGRRALSRTIRTIRTTSANPVAAVAPGARPGDGLVGAWRFEDGAGSVRARDTSGAGVDCELRGMDTATAWATGRVGGGLAFGGLGWLRCPRPSFGVGGSPDLTVALWVKRTAAAPGYHALVTRQAGQTPLDHFYLGFRGESLLVNSHLWGGKIFYPAPPVGRWFHLAAVQGHGEVVLFVDGRPVARRPARAHAPVDVATALTVGGGVNGPDPAVATQRFTGLLDELQVWHRPLSDDEIRRLATVPAHAL